MLAITAKPLSDITKTQLNAHSATIEGIEDFPAQIAKAKGLWEAKTPESLFRELRTTLANMCNGVRRCMYCEDSEADEIEHRRPKSLYPHQTFDWDNLLYTCGVCNGPKNNNFAVLNSPFSAGYTEGKVKKNAIPTPPPLGKDALIDPRKENPLELLELELEETFRFSPRINDKNSEQYWKAEYTIKILRLNRDTLWKTRRCAFRSYRSKLQEYLSDKQGKILELQEFLQESYHRTVWEEMKRQYDQHDDLRNLFQQAPEALAW